jgi:hypothetical protein
MKLKHHKRSAPKFAGRNKTKTSKANNLKVTKSAWKFFRRIIQEPKAIGNYPTCEAM